jgi:hypothetical protein
MRLLVGISRTTQRWHAWFGLVWLVLIGATASKVGFLRSDHPHDAPRVQSVASAAVETTDDVLVEEAGIGADLGALANSSLFRAPVVRARPKQSAIVPDLGNELQLHGVIGGDDPQAIIYHTRTQQTHSVRVGQKFGEFEVIEIHSMKVILQWRDETIELSM